MSAKPTREDYPPGPEKPVNKKTNGVLVILVVIVGVIAIGVIANSDKNTISTSGKKYTSAPVEAKLPAQSEVSGSWKAQPAIETMPGNVLIAISEATLPPSYLMQYVCLSDGNELIENIWISFPSSDGRHMDHVRIGWDGGESGEIEVDSRPNSEGVLVPTDFETIFVKLKTRELVVVTGPGNFNTGSFEQMNISLNGSSVPIATARNACYTH